MGPEDLKPEKKFARMIHRWKVGATSEKRNFWKFDELSAPLSVRSIISVWGLHDTSRLWGFELSRPKRELFTQILHDQISLEPAYQIPIWMQINSIVFSTRFQSPSQGSESFGGSSREFCLSLSLSSLRVLSLLNLIPSQTSREQQSPRGSTSENYRSQRLKFFAKSWVSMGATKPNLALVLSILLGSRKISRIDSLRLVS